MSEITLIVGLGNPGAQYEQTRHNAGFWFLDQLVFDFKTTFSIEQGFFGFLAKTQLNGRRVYLLKPTTFMNLSGRSVQAVSQFYKISTQDILVVHDELDIPCGQIKLKKGGGHAGHNGLRSIQGAIGGDFWRLRIGIDHPRVLGLSQAVADYVLHRPNPAQMEAIEEAMNRGRVAMSDILNQNVDKAHRLLSES